MRLNLAFILAAVALAGAAEKKAPPPDPAPAAAAKPAVKPPQGRPLKDVKVPEGAVETEPGTWKYTDPAGVKWIYRETPFGIGKYRASEIQEDKKTASRTQEAEFIKAAADGDLIRFERPGPFGVYKWTKKITELDEVEKAAWARAKAASGHQE